MHRIDIDQAWSGEYDPRSLQNRQQHCRCPAQRNARCPALAEGGEVSVELDAAHRQIVIAPAADGVDVEFARQVADFIESYRPAIEALAR